MGITVLAVLVVVFSSGSDIDADGILDQFDNCPDFPNPTQIDSDSDRQGNECDSDDDNDMVEDEIDLFDEDPYESYDFDIDGIGDNTDPDDDNDKVVDRLDAFDTDSSEWADFDFDGVGSKQDSDDDNDGILDTEDPTPIFITEQLAEKYFNQIQNCAEIESDTYRLLCYGTFFGILVEAEDSNADALELALSLSKVGALDDCHFVSHAIGHAAFEENHDVTSTLEGIDSSICRGGFYHGVLAAYFHNIKKEGIQFPDSYSNVCDGLIGSVDYLSCLHGLGHGLMHYFVSDIKAAVSKCNELSYFPGYQCLTGAFMQHADNELTRAKSPENVISKICVKENLAIHDYILCNMQLGTAIAFHTDHNYAQGEKICILLKDVDAINYCLEGLDSEINTANKELVDPITRIDRPIIQPIWIKDDPKWSISIVSKTLVSEFDYEDNIIKFKINQPETILIFAHKNLIDESVIINLNDNDVAWQNVPIRNHDYLAILIEANEAGIIKISK
jgi:hypothetical protein